MNSSNIDSDALFGIIFSSVFVIIWLIIMLLIIGVYVVQSIGLYRIAVKMGHKSPWMAWIPFANTYLMFTLPEKPFRVLAINKEIQDRSNAFWIYLAITMGGGIVAMVLAFIPIIGTLVLSVFPLLLNVAMIFMLYPMYKDLYEIFFEDSQSTVFSILSMFIPFAVVVIFMIAASKQPRAPKELEGQIYYQ